MVKKKNLVLSTAASVLTFLVGITAYQVLRPPDPITLNTEGYPTIGNRSAKVEVVVIEDFRCCKCREFSERVIPQIRSRYVQAGYARITVIPVAFISGSKQIANAALEVYRISPDLFFPFIEEIFKESQGMEIGEKELVRIAGKVGVADIVQLESCIQTRCHYDELEKNLHWAQVIMGREFGTPAVYVNGIPVSTLSFQSVEERIDHILHERS